MTILEKIKADSLQARKLRDSTRASLLTTLLSEAQAVGKNAGRETTDEETIQVIKKFVKNAEQTSRDALASIQTNKMDVIQRASDEVKILSEYLPKQLTEDEIKVIIHGLKNPTDQIMGADMKSIMSYFKNMYPGQYDGAVVARHAK